METFSASLAISAGNSTVTGEFPVQRPVTRSFDVFCDLSLNKRLSKQWWGWRLETPSRPLWRHCNERCRWLKILTTRTSTSCIANTIVAPGHLQQRRWPSSPVSAAERSVLSLVGWCYGEQHLAFFISTLWVWYMADQLILFLTDISWLLVVDKDYPTQNTIDYFYIACTYDIILITTIYIQLWWDVELVLQNTPHVYPVGASYRAHFFCFLKTKEQWDIDSVSAFVHKEYILSAPMSDPVYSDAWLCIKLQRLLLSVYSRGSEYR